jgi:ABC-type lipoprotein export system ATPase subunit
MLESLVIKNYRSCQSTTFKPRRDLSILIGQNGSGKTNILNAILLLQKICHPPESKRGDQSFNECKLQARFNIDGKSLTLFARIVLDTDEFNRDVVAYADISWYMPDFTNSKKRVHFPMLMPDSGNYNGYVMYRTPEGTRAMIKDSDLSIKGAVDPIRKVTKYILGSKYYSASQFTNPSSCPVSFEIEKEGGKVRGVRLRGHSKFLYDLYESYKNPTQAGYKEFVDIVGPDGIGLVDEISFQEISTSVIGYTVRSGGRVRSHEIEKLLIIPQIMIGSNRLSPNQLSEGTFKTITLLFHLITESSSLLLIEEPEVCVHHGLLTSIISLIKTYSSENQIIVSTHSDFVLDSVRPENVFRVSRDGELGTVLTPISKSLSKSELIALKNYLESEGNLGEFWKHGGLD